MDNKPNPKSPQFLTALVRKLKNIEPDYDVQFTETSGGVAFRMIDVQGRYRSKIINIGYKQQDALTSSRLQSHLRTSGFPGKFPQ